MFFRNVHLNTSKRRELFDVLPMVTSVVRNVYLFKKLLCLKKCIKVYTTEANVKYINEQKSLCLQPNNIMWFSFPPRGEPEKH